MKILYVKNAPYNKISAIKPDDFVFGSAELDENKFGIVTMDVPEDKIIAWSNKNQYCLNEELDEIIETPEEYLIQYRVDEIIEVNNPISAEEQKILDEARANAERFLNRGKY